MLSIKSSLICVEVCELAPAEAASQSQHIKLGGGTRDSRKMVSVNYLARSHTAGGGPSKILPAPRGTALKTVLKTYTSEHKRHVRPPNKWLSATKTSHSRRLERHSGGIKRLNTTPVHVCKQTGKQ